MTKQRVRAAVVGAVVGGLVAVPSAFALTGDGKAASTTLSGNSVSKVKAILGAAWTLCRADAPCRATGEPIARCRCQARRPESPCPRAVLLVRFVGQANIQGEVVLSVVVDGQSAKPRAGVSADFRYPRNGTIATEESISLGPGRHTVVLKADLVQLLPKMYLAPWSMVIEQIRS